MPDFRAMTVDSLKATLYELVGEPVAVKRIAANSILLYFFGGPGDPAAVGIFIDPSWRYERAGQVILGSYDLQLETLHDSPKAERDREFDRLCSLCEPIEGSRLANYKLDVPSFDITLELSGGQILRKFASSAFDEPEWTLYDDRVRTVVEVFPQGIRLRSKPTTGPNRGGS